MSHSTTPTIHRSRIPTSYYRSCSPISCPIHRHPRRYRPDSSRYTPLRFRSKRRRTTRQRSMPPTVSSEPPVSAEPPARTAMGACGALIPDVGMHSLSDGTHTCTWSQRDPACGVLPPMSRTHIGAALGARIRARREALGWSQAKLAEVIDLTPNYVGSLERGQALPTVQTLVVLAKALDTGPAELLGEIREGDGWIDDLVVVARTVAPAQRRLALALVRAVATEGAPSPRRRRAARRSRS